MGVRGGCEAIVHTVRALMEDTNIPQDSRCLLQVDLINAFNRANRETAFREVRRLFPELARWIESTYGTQAELIFGEAVILSCDGFHQGDPLACLLFSLVLHPIIMKISSEVPELLLNGWFLDDGALMGKVEDLSRAVSIIRQEGPARGLFLSTSATTPRPKSTIWCPDSPSPTMDPLGHGIPRIQEPGIILLGSPIGGHDFEQKFITNKIKTIRELTQLLPLIKDPHSEFVLLRSCFSLPKIVFLLRSTDPTLHQNLWATFDGLIRDTLIHILGSAIQDKQWAQAQLPVAMGGLGLRGAVNHSAGAFISSVYASEVLKEGLLPHGNVHLDISTAMALLMQRADELSQEELPEMTQKMISFEIDKKLKISLEQSLTIKRDKARLASLGLAHAGDWLNVIPSPVLGLHVRPQEFRYSVLYRLGAPIYTTDGACPACRKDSDRFGDHALVCGSHGERIARHNQLRDAIYSVAASSNLAPRKEENALLPGTSARPADVFIPHWTGGRDTALDVTVVSPLLTDRLDNSISTPGHTLTVAFNEKCRDYLEPCEREGLSFIPLPVETLGGWHDKACDQIKKLARAQARSSGKEEGDAVRHLFQRLGVLLVKGNSALMLNRIPSFPLPEIDGDL